MSCLKAEDRPANVSDELVLSISGILGMDEKFYLLYSEFIDDARSGIAQLIAHAQDLLPSYNQFAEWRTAVDAVFAEPQNAIPLARYLLSSPRITGSILMLSDALLDPKLDYPGFNFLCAYIALHLDELKDYGNPRPEATLRAT